MTKLAFFAPTAPIARNARRIITEEKRNDIEVVAVSTGTCVQAAQKAAENGTQIIIARGTQAAAIRRATNTPVVEVVLTAQEMGLVVQQAKATLGIAQPRIAVVGYGNMFCDMRHFNQLFGVHLLEYYVDTTAELPGGVEKAKSDGADMVIGGEIVCKTAKTLGIPALLQPDGEDSIRQALRVAESVAFAAQQEKKIASELNTLLDFSFSGLAKLDEKGNITALNSRFADMFTVTAKQLTGQHIEELIPGFFAEHLRGDVLEGGRDIFTVVRAPKLVLAVGASPIIVGGTAGGCILSCHEVDRLTEMEIETRREMQQDTPPAAKFAHYFLQDTIFMRTLRHCAKFSSHVLLTAEPCTPRQIPAQLVHSESLRSNKSYITFCCAAYPPEQHAALLFGEAGKIGLLQKSNQGTLFLDSIEALDSFAQARLYDTLATGTLAQGTTASPKELDVRVIAGTDRNLWQLVEESRFNAQLYYTLTTLVLPLPGLDAERWAPVFVQQYCNRHYRYLHLTKSARAAIAQHSWNGLLELDKFCERLVITAPQRTADAAMIQRMLSQERLMQASPQRFARNPEAARLADMLERFDGNRALAAEALGISKTTLWRRMKKLGLYDEPAPGKHMQQKEE